MIKVHHRASEMLLYFYLTVSVIYSLVHVSIIVLQNDVHNLRGRSPMPKPNQI